MLDYLEWRQADCQRNSVGMLAHSSLPGENLDGLTNSERKHLLIASGVSWDHMDPGFRYGTFVKRQEIEILSEYNGETKRALRRRSNLFVEPFSTATPPSSQLEWITCSSLPQIRDK
eukprot:TRINITY_DN2983_c0_g1_i2.p2 TRINITY_DN2983_c0_g1~~TRINITY_DN2983_c0_g1_i2.p2  ORF type:complete len:117 (+),score=10.85 TRINITY_DN2983_c0_g1_i2:642-992(+)